MRSSPSPNLPKTSLRPANQAVTRSGQTGTGEHIFPSSQFTRAATRIRPFASYMCEQQAVSGIPELHWRQTKMSITSFNGGQPSSARPKVTVTTIQDKKQRRERITCLTAYDYANARLVDEAGIDMILVGDSLAQTMLGYENTLSVTMDEMLP